MNNMQKKILGHLAALICVIIWGTTFISTKILLNDFAPVEILFFRFVMGFLALIIIYPHRMGKTNWKQEIMLAGAGLSGICLYFMLENVSLTYTLASNAGVIISVAPFFTGVLLHLVDKEKEKLGTNFFVGFVVAMAGISLIGFNGSRMQLNPLGDLLVVLAAAAWAFYSLFIRKIGDWGYNTILTTRRIFAYGLLFMIPELFFFDFRLGLERFQNPIYVGNIIFLGLGASALCFVMWNKAVELLGAVKTSIYIYLGPVITVVTSAIILKEPITGLAVCGTALVLLGLVVSEFKGKPAQK